MEKIAINTLPGYTVTIGGGLAQNAGTLLSGIASPEKLMVISDENVFPLYGKKILSSLTSSGFQCFSRVFTPGEKTKSPENLFLLWNLLAQNGFSRSDAVLSLGGGVISDLGGFAAATYMRGIKHFIFPTTLLSMADASVGGKTAIDLPNGKNLAGAFYAPSAVFCDPTVLDTLPAENRAEGMAEIIKCGMIGSAALFSSLSATPSAEEMIRAAVQIKKRFTESDEKDNGERKKLNFGHTLAHAAETLSEGNMSHGKAVAAGMYAVTKASVKNGICPSDVLTALEKLLDRYALPKVFPFSLQELCMAARNDKKRSGGTVTLVLPKKIGEAILQRVPIDRLYDFFT